MQIQYYTTYIIALANSCQAMVDVLKNIKVQFWKAGTTTTTNDAKIATTFDAVLTVYQVSPEDEIIYPPIKQGSMARGWWVELGSQVTMDSQSENERRVWNLR